MSKRALESSPADAKKRHIEHIQATSEPSTSGSGDSGDSTDSGSASVATTVRQPPVSPITVSDGRAITISDDQDTASTQGEQSIADARADQPREIRCAESGSLRAVSQGASDEQTESSEDSNARPTAEQLRNMRLPQLKDLCFKAGGPRIWIHLQKDKQALINKLEDLWAPLSEEETLRIFRAAGVRITDSVNRCLLAAVQKRYVPLTSSGKLKLDRELYRGPCSCCGGTLACTIRDALYQQMNGSDYDLGAPGGAAQKGACKKSCGGQYVTQLCCNNPSFESGKFHNHCSECPGFGTCIQDYREVHCRGCGWHEHRLKPGKLCHECLQG